jgi:hypothetical protein
MTMENLRRVRQLSNQADARNMDLVMTSVYRRLGNFGIQSAALATGSTKPKITSGAAWYGVVGGVLVKKAATANLITLTTASNCANALFNVTVFTIDSAGTITNRAGTAGATLAAMTWPTLPATEAVFGILIVNPTGTGGFVGGTTDLDDATVVPNAVYLNPLGAGSYSAIANL